MGEKTGWRGMSTFAVIWAGQLVSLIGSGLTSFALGVWVFERTGSVTQFALIGLSAALARTVLSPLAGVIVDRWDRRWLMILSDAGAGLCTLAIAGLLAADRLQIWHIYLAVALSAAFGAVQWPAYTAAITRLVPQGQLGRANGMVQFGQAAADILSPLLAGSLVQTIGLSGVIWIDVATFAFAVVSLLVVRFPAVRALSVAQPEKETFWREMTLGWRYIVARRGLFGLLLFLTVVNFIWGTVGALVVPMILSFAPSDVLGALLSIAGMGLLAGSLIMSAWGGPRRRINGVLGFELLSGFCFLLMGFRPSFGWIAAGALGAHMTIAIVYGSNQAIWQSKVAPDVQGRVFATQQMIARAAVPLAYLLAGPVAERLFEPLLSERGSLAASLGPIIGTGPGRGIGLMFIGMGLIKIVVSLTGYLLPKVRRVEDELPDVAAVS
jgi:DHA3 family macrolide efflux protein-like MFS transporter